MPEKTGTNAGSQEAFSRTRLILGPEAMERLRNSRVAVFGLGGVGGYAAEALARSGIGALDLIDHDRFSLSNLNRQLHATRSTLGKFKADIVAERTLDINPDCRVRALRTFFLPETRDQFDFSQYDYVVDAIDTVAGKLALIEAAEAAGTPIICSMGAGNKTDPTAFRVADLYQTSVCPLARIMRSECRKRGIQRLKVVYSTEPPIRVPAASSPASGISGHRPDSSPEEDSRAFQDDDSAKTELPPGRRTVPGSVAFVPSVAGLIIAGEVVRDLIHSPERKAAAGKAPENLNIYRERESKWP